MTRHEVHIIQNREIGLSECGSQLPLNEASTATPWPMANGDIAIWDDDIYPEGYAVCTACDWAYMVANPCPEC